ncbi:NADPH-dependent F420 reductase [Archangium violaceum]|uniref:NADP oxidoreductase n=1 Tax=Archangium violaceum Cb vi76 TaxID=1406225 RepID=A0A084SH73_9BACT|nr:NAD(P)-binding domain-containing protein [Archangium violaceum]KFA87808.1 NADP oxidoreductase [Archangium violaceum Cb vi76]
MKIAVLGTGMVGETIGSKLVALGHEVKMGSRSATNEKAAAWVKKAGAKASQGTFADATAFGELLFNCTSGSGSLEALNAAGKENLEGKSLLDLSNPLEFSKGMPPTLFVSNTDSLGEQIQRAFPALKVVKTLNTISANVMVDPSRIPGEHAVFVSGNDAEAKGQVKRLLTEWFGWKQVIDLGDITTARGTESYLPLWLRLWGAMGTPDFNIQIVKKG